MARKKKQEDDVQKADEKPDQMENRQAVEEVASQAQPMEFLVKDEKSEPEPVQEETAAAEEEDEAIEQLRAQFRALEERYAAERRAREEAESKAARAAAEIKEAQKDTIANAIAAAQAEAQEAERQLKEALEEADYDKAAQAQRALVRAESKLSRLEEGKADLETKQPEPQKASAVADDPIEAYIAQFSRPSQDYLRKHKEVISNPKLNSKLIAGHHMAIAEGLQPDTEEYFSYLDRHMGYAAPARTPQATRVLTSAPVSRDVSTSNGKLQGTRITLTPSQVEAAKALGITPAEYARRLAIMRSPDWQGPRFTN